MPLEPRLRPAALVVLPRLLLRAVDDLFQAAGAELIDLAALAVHDRHEGAVAVTCELDERREPQPPTEVDVVGHRARERQHAPEAICAGDEDRDATRSVAFELAAPPRPDPLEVAARRHFLVVRAAVPVRELLLCASEQRAEARLRARRGRCRRGVEIEEEAERAPVRRREPRQLAAAPPRSPSPPLLRRYLAGAIVFRWSCTRSDTGHARSRSSSSCSRRRSGDAGRRTALPRARGGTRSSTQVRSCRRSGRRASPYRHALELGGRLSNEPGEARFDVPPGRRVPRLRGTHDDAGLAGAPSTVRSPSRRPP